MDNVALKSPTRHGDTLYAYSEVLSKLDTGEQGGGEVRFRHYGVNQAGRLVFQGDRTVLLRKQPGTLDVSLQQWLADLRRGTAVRASVRGTGRGRQGTLRAWVGRATPR